MRRFDALSSCKLSLLLLLDGLQLNVELGCEPLRSPRRCCIIRLQSCSVLSLIDFGAGGGNGGKRVSLDGNSICIKCGMVVISGDLVDALV